MALVLPTLAAGMAALVGANAKGADVPAPQGGGADPLVTSSNIALVSDCQERSSIAACDAADSEGSRPHFQVTAELSLVSDFRRGGVTQSDNDPALQGRIDIKHHSGWSAGAFASSINGRRGSNAQVTLFGARRFDIGEAQLTLGASELIFIGGDAEPFAIAQASFSYPIGPVDLTLSVSYAPPQAALDEYGLNFTLRARTPLGRINDAPLTAAISIGRSEGEFAAGAETKLDWSLGLTTEFADTEVGIAYVDNDLDDDRGDAGLIFSFARRF
jgi:uncharacterized protein (TIGR02001 family)